MTVGKLEVDLDLCEAKMSWQGSKKLMYKGDMGEVVLEIHKIFFSSSYGKDKLEVQVYSFSLIFLKICIRRGFLYIVEVGHEPPLTLWLLVRLFFQASKETMSKEGG